VDLEVVWDTKQCCHDYSYLVGGWEKLSQVEWGSWSGERVINIVVTTGRGGYTRVPVYTVLSLLLFVIVI